MKRLRVWSALMVAAFVATGSFAQTNEDLQRQLNELKASMQNQQSKIQRLETENSALKTDRATPQDVGLETEINRLSERMAAGTNLRSCASQIKLGGEFRFRAQYADNDDNTNGSVTEGQQGNNEATGFWGDSRIRLNFQYDFGCDATAFAELQAHYGAGQDFDGVINEWDGNDSVGNVGVYQAWLELRNLFSSSALSARIGRQEVVLGNQFQFGNADWYNGVVHDGIRGDWRSNCWSLTGLAAKLTTEDGDFNQIPSYFDNHDDDELYSLYLTIRSIRNIQIDGYWIYVNGHGGFAHNSGASLPVDAGFLYPTTHAYYHTFGARIGGNLNIFCGLDFNLEGAIQTGTGTFGGGGSVDVDGSTVEGEVGLTFSKRARFRIFARGLWAEGGDSGSTGYLINFPNRHSNTGFRARYGIADIIPMTNVLTAQVGAHFDPACNWTLGATGLWAESDQDNPITGDPTDYGSELDLWAEYRYTQQITLGAGVAIIFPKDDFGFGDSSFWTAYVQARLVF